MRQVTSSTDHMLFQHQSLLHQISNHPMFIKSDKNSQDSPKLKKLVKESIDLPCHIDHNRRVISLRDPQKYLNPWAVDTIDLSPFNQKIKILKTDYLVNGTVLFSLDEACPSFSDDLTQDDQKTESRLEITRQFGDLWFQHTPNFVSLSIDIHYDLDEDLADDLKKDDELFGSKVYVRLVGYPFEQIDLLEQLNANSGFQGYADLFCFPIKYQSTKINSEIGLSTYRLSHRGSCILLKMNSSLLGFDLSTRMDLYFNWDEKPDAEHRILKKMTIQQMISEAELFQSRGGLLKGDGWLVIPLVFSKDSTPFRPVCQDCYAKCRYPESGSVPCQNCLIEKPDQKWYPTKWSPSYEKWWNIRDVKHANTLLNASKLESISIKFTPQLPDNMTFDLYWWSYNTLVSRHTGFFGNTVYNAYA